ncbi:MAG: hypothetical protein RL693_1782, partial [Verrucomicrobiota bacterium]
ADAGSHESREIIYRNFSSKRRGISKIKTTPAFLFYPTPKISSFMKALPLALFAALTFATISSKAEDAKITVGDFSFTVSAPWKEGQNTGMMTKAVLNFPVEGGDPLDAKFYHFGSGQGGDVESNVKRWIAQFEGSPEVKKEEVAVADGSKVTLLTITGTYLDGPPFGGTKTPRPDYALLGAILVGKDSPVFIKLTGPKASTTAAQESFKKLATSPFAK